MPRRTIAAPPARSTSTARSRRLGHTLAHEVLEARREALAARAAAAAAPRHGARARAAAVAARPIAGGTLVAEGDSWFDYPMYDVLKALEDVHGFDVESVAQRGDTVEDMAYGKGQLDALVRRIEKVLRRGNRLRAILLSGGGNDIAGDEFGVLLNHARSGRPGIEDAILDALVERRIGEAFLTVLAATTEICRSLTGGSVPILVHGYAYPVPDGRGFAGGWAFLPGPWLEPGLRRKGYDPVPDGKPLLVTMIDRFNRMLARIPTLPGYEHVRYVDLRAELPSDHRYRDWWANELHPTRAGYTRIAARFAAAI